MLQVNEYFDGKVKSIAVNNAEGNATTGVIEPGEFEFDTNTKEHMTVTFGEMMVQLPGKEDWKLYKQNESFTVGKGLLFRVKVSEPVSYLCTYE